MEYFENIKRLRKEKNWTQQELAEKLQVSRQTVARWESGWNVPNFLSAQKMSELFGVSVGELMTGENSPVSTEKNAEGLPSLIWFSALCIAFAVLFRVLGNLLPELSKALGAVLFSAILLLGVWWGSKLLENFLKTDEKYARKLYYKIWRLGLWIYGAAFCTVCIGFFEKDFAPELEIFGIVFSGTFCFVSLDTLLRLLLRNKMVTEKNPLKICDIIFLILSVLSLTAIAVLVGISDERTAMIYFTVFWTLLGFFGCGYFLLRTILSLFLCRKRNQKQAG